MTSRLARPTFVAGAILALASSATAGTMPYFTPLTESAPVTEPNSEAELGAPWIVPAGVAQRNLTSMSEIEADPTQSISRAPDISVPGSGEQDVTAGSSQSMWDMAAFDSTGRYVFIPHESPWSAGLSRYDRDNDRSELLWNGDGQGALEDWSNDFAAFDPATFTPNCTVFVAEEWSGEGRLIETLNPFAPVDRIETRELESIANVAHEGLRFSHDRKTLYYIDEWNSGSIYKFVLKNAGDYTVGQTFVLAVDAFAGNPADNFNEASNAGQPRTGPATWVPITDADGHKLTTADPFLNGPTNDPRTNSDTRGGRPAADEVNGTPYGRPEDMEVARLANGNEVVYFTATSEQAVYAIEMLGDDEAEVRLFVGPQTPKNVGFEPTTAVLNSPDNLAQDALGNLFIIEDAPNGSSTGGDIWFARDLDADGVAESIDHFMSLRVSGSEATGMIFNPLAPTEFVVHIQHPDSTDLDLVPGGFGDALWEFDIKGAADRRTLSKLRAANRDLVRANKREMLRCAQEIRKQQRVARKD
ncbi:MAG: DUF839 domain-containing protein [Myxococcota bacterium]